MMMDQPPHPFVKKGSILHVTKQVSILFQSMGDFSPEEAWRHAKWWVQEICHLSPTQWVCCLQEICPDLDTLNAYLTAFFYQHKPLSRSVGKKFFWKNFFSINPWTLDPRPETEGVVEHALRVGGDLFLSGGHILDMGTGTGCILLSIIRTFPQLRGMGSDVEERVFPCAQANARALGASHNVQWIQSNWWENIPCPEEKFVCVVSNPPYIPHEDMHHLSPMVTAWDPSLALDGGDDGLSAYRKIFSGVENYLAPNGFVVLEIGASQGASVKKMASILFPYVIIHQDLCHRDRYCIASFRPL